ncbi:MAG: pyridoxal phosphate-dependent aminotransferase, partial [Planctomycetota bacterium]
MVILEKETVDRMIKLSQNENPFGASPRALKAIADNYRSVYRYPDVKHDELKDRLARKFNVSPDHIVVAAGAVAVVDLAIKALVGFDDNVVTAEKTFVAYKLLAGINRRECKSAPLAGNTISLDNVGSLCDGKTRVLFIANPNNPTGTILPHAEVSEFLKALPRRIVVVLDEAYAEYVTDSAYPDSFQLQKEFENLVILRTFSKIYGLAGLRIG